MLMATIYHIYKYSVDTTDVKQRYEQSGEFATGFVLAQNRLDALVKAFKKDKRLSEYIFFKWRTDWAIIRDRLCMDDYPWDGLVGLDECHTETVINRYYRFLDNVKPDHRNMDCDISNQSHLQWLENERLMETSDMTRREIILLKRYFQNCIDYDNLASAIYESPEVLFKAMHELSDKSIENLADCEIRGGIVLEKVENTCIHGFTETEITNIVGDRQEQFKPFMRGRTMMICNGKPPCTEAHGTVVYMRDLVMFLS